MTVDSLTVDCVTDWMLNFGGVVETKSDRGDHVINEARAYVYWSGHSRMHKLLGDNSDDGDTSKVE